MIMRERQDPTGDVPDTTASGHFTPSLILGLLANAMLISTYFVVRFGGLWAENDTATLALAIDAVRATGELIPPKGLVYPSGYAHPVISNTIVAMSGLSVGTLQVVVYPLVSALLIIPAWALYLELTQSRRAATIAVLLLFVQPEFLFVILRGSHERFLRLFVFVALWLLVRSFRYRLRPTYLALHVVLFYFVSYAIIATNALFGVSFIAAIGLAMVMALAFNRVYSPANEVVRPVAGRLVWVVLAIICLSFVFIYYVYPPAGYSLSVLGNLIEKAIALFFTTQAGASPYGQVTGGWISLPVYFLVSIGTFSLMLSSVVIWLWQLYRWLRHIDEPPSLPIVMLWILYCSFAIQGGLALVSDLSGQVNANLQHRSFPSFAMVATPVVALALTRIRPSAWMRILAGVVFALLSMLAILKASNEPALSRKWTIYTSDELQTITWVDAHDQGASIWIGIDERLASANAIVRGLSARGNRWDDFEVGSETRMFIISDVMSLHSQATGRVLPAVGAENRIYDNGSVQVYRLRAQTPYQR